MNANGLAKHYDKLTAEERFALTMQAIARDDDPELARLGTAAQRFRLSVPDTSPYLDAFQEVRLCAMIELLDLAAYLDDMMSHLDEAAAEQGRDSYYDVSEVEAALANAESTDEVSLQVSGLVMSAGYLLKTRMAGWQLWCVRRHLPPLAFLKDLPGYERMMRVLELTQDAPDQRGRAFTAAAMLHWINQLARRLGKPNLTELPCTAETIADDYEWLFEVRRRSHAGEPLGKYHPDAGECLGKDPAPAR